MNNCWVISPNVINNGDVDFWLDATKKTGMVFPGYGSDSNTGRVFDNQVNIGDIMIVARGSGNSRQIYLAGIIDGEREYVDQYKVSGRKLKNILGSDDVALAGVKLDESNAYKNSSNTGALYRLKDDNPSDRQVIITFNSLLLKKDTISNMQEFIDLIKFKKQIILQGPPGTGKTYTAKEIARQLISTDSGGRQVLPDETDVKALLSRDEHVPMRNSNKFIRVAELSERSVKVSYREGKFFSLKFNRIADCVASGNFTRKGGDAYLHALAEYILKKWLKNNKRGEYVETSSSQIRLIQFHPAYSYEDFVRGITAKTFGSSVEYRTENRILAEFASQALENYEDSQKEIKTLSREIWIKEQVNLFADSVQEIIDRNGKYPINEKVSIFEVDKNAFRYVGDSWAVDNKQRMKFSDLIISYLNNAKNRQDIKAINEISGRAKQHASYDFKMLEKLRGFIPTEPTFENSSTQVDEKQYILIIDEINRANLPAVLGELIYALEYRGEPVESTYDLDGDRTLVLPPNLYIIGTMNTADKSVGHIDYAIRRRFAFVDVLPSPVPVHAAAKNLFKQVSELFVRDYDLIDWQDPKPIRSQYVATDFRPEDIWIGHSYFMSDKQDDEGAKADIEIRLKYEILPLLKEYIKDGLLLPEAEVMITKLHV